MSVRTCVCVCVCVSIPLYQRLSQRFEAHGKFCLGSRTTIKNCSTSTLLLIYQALLYYRINAYKIIVHQHIICYDAWLPSSDCNERNGKLPKFLCLHLHIFYLKIRQMLVGLACRWPRTTGWEPLLYMYMYVRLCLFVFLYRSIRICVPVYISLSASGYP